MFIGIDLAWGPNGRTGLAVGAEDGRLLDSASVRTDAEVDGWLAGRRPAVVAIDAPLVVPNESGARFGERRLGEAYARFHAGAHPTNRGTRHMDPPRGLELARRHGWSVDPAHPGSADAPSALEVYPHPGMVGLFRLGRVIPYKRKPGRSHDARRSAFERLLGLLEELQPLRAAESTSWARIRAGFDQAAIPAQLDRLEDEVDAVFCAHLAWLWAARPGALQVYGDVEQGYIVAPPPPDHAPGPLEGSADPQESADTPLAEPDPRRSDQELRIREPEPELLVGVGPHPEPWPEGDRWDPQLLREGDRRNVVDRYRYWTVEAITADLDARRHPFAVAIENWQHDLNIGSIVRTANAFLADSVHIVGRRRWNRRGAMVTDRYQHVVHHEDVAGLVAWARGAGMTVVAVDNVERSVPVDAAALPERCLLLFGQEGPGLTPEALAAADAVVAIPQYGSTRSINAAAAAAIVMHEWVRRWAEPTAVSADQEEIS